MIKISLTTVNYFQYLILGNVTLPEDRYKDFRKVVFEEKAIFLGKDKRKYILFCNIICIELCSK